MAHDVFISYSRKDQVIADAVCKILEDSKIKCWIDHRDYVVGEVFTATLKKAIEDSKVLLLIYSGHSNESDFVMKEVLWADKKHKDIIPFCIEKTPIREELAMTLSFLDRKEAYAAPCINNIEELAESVENRIKTSEQDFEADHKKIRIHQQISETPCQSIKSTMYCPNCGLPYPKDDQCPDEECNKALASKQELLEENTVPQIKEKECPECQTSNPTYANYCNYCAHPFKSKKDPQRDGRKNFIPDDGNKKSPLKNAKILILIILFISLAFAGTLYYFINPTQGVVISNPTSGQTIPQYYTVKGKVRTLNSGEQLYVLIKPDNFNWFVQDKPVISSDGSWECKVQFGEAGDKGYKFIICTIISKDIINYNTEYGANLPNYSEKSQINVTRT